MHPTTRIDNHPRTTCRNLVFRSYDHSPVNAPNLISSHQLQLHHPSHSTIKHLIQQRMQPYPTILSRGTSEIPLHRQIPNSGKKHILQLQQTTLFIQFQIMYHQAIVVHPISDLVIDRELLMISVHMLTT